MEREGVAVREGAPVLEGVRKGDDAPLREDVAALDWVRVRVLKAVPVGVLLLLRVLMAVREGVTPAEGDGASVAETEADEEGDEDGDWVALVEADCEPVSVMELEGVPVSVSELDAVPLPV